MAILTDLNAGQRDEVTFISGLEEDGQIGNDTYYTWNYKDFSKTNVWLNKWYNDSKGVPLAATSEAGTPGGTVTYSFSADLPYEAQSAYTAALTLWSDIADINFEYVSTNTTANVLFQNETGSSGVTFIPNNGSKPIGSKDIPAQASPNTRGGQADIGIPVPDWAWSNFSKDASWYMGTIAHETGHLLGLGHSGYYNGDTDEGQRGVYDQNLWTLMSYNGTDKWTSNSWQAPIYGNWQGGSAQTPMALDILAAQRIYGESKSRTFAGGQTYGFNTNIRGPSRDFYDFTLNDTPFVSIYNRGVNNTLDVSGFSTNSWINLNPGTFSSASSNSAITNNINISFGTRIDKAITGSGDDVIYGNSNSNVVEGGDGDNTFVITGSSANFTIDKTSTVTTVTDKTTGAVDTLTNIDKIQFIAPVCFTTGTRIAVVRDGIAREVAVQDLRVGDLAVTATGGSRPIRWIGRREVRPVASPVPASQWPVRILAGAFGTDACGQAVPARDLRLSPGHPVLIGADAANAGGVLVPIMNLIDGIAICREAVDRVTYWHVELDRHDILLAEGLPAESYFESGTRAWFGRDTAQDWRRDMDGIAGPLPGRCRPVAFDGPIVEAERCRLGSALRLRLAAQAAWPSLEARTMAAA